MPTNFSGSLNPLVVLKTIDEKCSLRRHFTGCARQVIGYLDLLATNDPDRLVWISVGQIQMHCKNYDKKDSSGKPTTYSKSMVNKALKCFRDESILSNRAAVALQERRGYKVEDAFVVTPHEALTNRQGKACRWVGMGRVSETTWAAAPGGGVWFRAKSRPGELAATIEFTVGSGPQITPAITPTITPAITPVNEANTTQKESDGYTHNSMEAAEPYVDTDQLEKVFPKFSESPFGPNLVSQVSPLKLEAPNNPAPNGNSKGKSEDKLSVSTELTDLTKGAAMEKTGPAYTVGQHFVADRISSARGLFDLLTDGELEFDNPAMREYEKKDYEFEFLERACRDVVTDRQDKVLAGRRSLADLMHASAVILKSQHNLLAPKPWYRIMGTLRDGDQPLREKEGAVKTFDGSQSLRNYCNPYAHTWLHELFHNAVKETKCDLTPWEAGLVKYTRFLGNERVGYSNGWAAIHALMLLDKQEGKEESPVLTAVRDWLWEHDFMHGKADVPPWVE